MYNYHGEITEASKKDNVLSVRTICSTNYLKVTHMNSFRDVFVINPMYIFGMKRVLVIEDDPNIVELIKIHLKDLNFEVITASDGMAGLKTFEDQEFDLVILDLMLPKLDGMEVCRRMKKQREVTPILILTAKSEEIDKVLGLETGADDYMTKPFSVREFIARVKAIFRRIEVLHDKQDATILRRGALTIDRDKRKVLKSNRRIELTAKEFDLLWLFATHPGRTYTRQELLDLVWGYHYDGYDHTVNSHINRLRSKIEDDVTQPQYIHTSWGVGYRFAEPNE